MNAPDKAPDKAPDTVPEKATEKASAEKPEVKAPTADLASMSVAELKSLAKERGIAGITAMKKAELIAALS